VFSCSNAARLFEAAVGGAVVAVYAMGQLCLLSLWGGGSWGGVSISLNVLDLCLGRLRVKCPCAGPSLLSDRSSRREQRMTMSLQNGQ